MAYCTHHKQAGGARGESLMKAPEQRATRGKRPQTTFNRSTGLSFVNGRDFYEKEDSAMGLWNLYSKGVLVQATHQRWNSLRGFPDTCSLTCCLNSFRHGTPCLPRWRKAFAILGWNLSPYRFPAIGPPCYDHPRTKACAPPSAGR